jgi:G3E family GTPase
LAVVVLLLWGYLLILMFEATEEQARRLATAEAQLARFLETAAEKGWEARRDHIATVRARLTARLWSAETEGQAQADFQELVSRTARESALGRPLIRIDRDPTQAPSQGLRTISASISADFSPETLEEFLHKLASNERSIVIRSLRVTRQPLPRMDMLLAIFQGPPTAGACSDVATSGRRRTGPG